MENKLPINRLSKFFSTDDFDLHIQMGQEYLHGDGKDEIKYFPPIEFNALVKIDEPKNSSYKNGTLRYLEPGNLLIQVYIKHLEELKIDVRYGDYIAYPESEGRVRYYNVINDGKVTSDNKHNHFGFKPYYRTITCAPVQEGEFRGV